jgi:hypothetical protein
MTDERYSFPGIYGPNYDDTPDQDHANGLSIGFIHTLLASSEEKNLLFGDGPKTGMCLLNFRFIFEIRNRRI